MQKLVGEGENTYSLKQFIKGGGGKEKRKGKGKGKEKEEKSYMQINLQRCKRSLQVISPHRGGKTSGRILKMVVFNETLSISILKFIL